LQWQLIYKNNHPPLLRLHRQYDGAPRALFAFKEEDDPSTTICVVDSAVYTRFRHFRTIGCCKGGKRAVLRATRRYAGAYAGGGGAAAAAAAAGGDGGGDGRGPIMPAEMFLLSLIGNVHPGCKPLDLQEGFSGFRQQQLPVVSCNSQPH
jgi:hypothetical protein